mgnify:CR=1 FL=1
MLTLTRRVGEKILIGGGIEIEVVKIGTWRVQLRINAPSETKILRQELIPAQCPEPAADLPTPFPCPGCWGRGCLDCTWTGEVQV